MNAHRAPLQRLRPLARLLVESVLGVRSRPLGHEVMQEDLSQVIAAGREHRVTPALARRAGSAPDVPASWAAALNLHRHAQLLRHMQASSDVRRVGEAFQKSGTRWVLAKGPVAADLIWPASDMREYYDVDVFVDRRDFAVALRHLEDVGFVLVDRNWPELLKTMRAEIALRGPAGTHLDLHWDIAVPPPLRRAFRTDMRGMLGRARPARLCSGVAVSVFDPTDTVLHLAFHAAQAGANKLMWMADIHHATGVSGFDWGELEARACRSRMQVPVALVIERASRTLGLVVAPPQSVLKGARGVWGQIARSRDDHAPFPGLPGDASLGGLMYASARAGLPASITQAARTAWAVRRTEARVAHRGPEDRVLYRNVPDAEARRAYLAAVTGQVG